MLQNRIIINLFSPTVRLAPNQSWEVVSSDLSGGEISNKWIGRVNMDGWKES